MGICKIDRIEDPVLNRSVGPAIPDAPDGTTWRIEERSSGFYGMVNGLTRYGPCSTAGRVRGFIKNHPSFHGGTKQACMTCRGEFLSEGNHNRMCPRCRSKSNSPLLDGGSI